MSNACHYKTEDNLKRLKICSWWCQDIPVKNICDHKAADRFQLQECKWNSFEELHRICSWKNQKIQVQHLWLWDCAKFKVKETH